MFEDSAKSLEAWMPNSTSDEFMAVMIRISEAQTKVQISTGKKCTDCLDG